MCFPTGNSAEYVYIGVGVGLLSKIFGYETMTAVEYGAIAAGAKYAYDRFPVMEPGPAYVFKNDEKKSCGC